MVTCATDGSIMTFAYSGSSCAGAPVFSNVVQPAGCTKLAADAGGPPGTYYVKVLCGSAVTVPTAFAYASMIYASQSDCTAGAAMMTNYIGL